MVVVNPSSYTYTGGKITPNYAVIDGAIALYKKGDIKDDTKAEYEEVSITDAVNVGTGTIKVKGINDFYSGTATGTFTITAANTSDVKVTIENEDYTGKQVRPRMNTINVTLNGNDVTNQFEIVSYGENKEAGKGTVVLKPVDGNKNFTGSNITAEFNIIKEKVTGKLNVYNSKGFEDSSHIFDYDGNAHTYAKAVLTLDKSNKTTAKESDFEIKYVDNVAGKNLLRQIMDLRLILDMFML